MKIQKINTGIIITKTAKQPSAKIEFSLDELDALSEFCERLQDEKDIREYLNTAVTIPDSAEVSAPIAAKYLRDAALFEQLVDETRRNQEENQSNFLTAVSDAVSSIEKSRDVKEWHGLTKETAERFAREFMAERNPGRWSGFGEVPESVSLDPLIFPINDIYPKGNKPALRMQLISVTYPSLHRVCECSIIEDGVDLWARRTLDSMTAGTVEDLVETVLYVARMYERSKCFERIFVNHIQMEKSVYDALIRHLNDPDSINDEYRISDVVFAADNTIVSVLWEGNSKDGVSGMVTLAMNGKTVYKTKNTKAFCNHWILPYNGAEYHVLVDVLPEQIILEETLYISKSSSKKLEKYLCGEEVQGFGSSLSETAKFSDGYSMDIRCCGDEDTSWAEAILYDNTGVQVAISETYETFIGYWELDDETTGKTYAYAGEQHNRREGDFYPIMEFLHSAGEQLLVDDLKRFDVKVMELATAEEVENLYRTVPNEPHQAAYIKVMDRKTDTVYSRIYVFCAGQEEKCLNGDTYLSNKQHYVLVKKGDDTYKVPYPFDCDKTVEALNKKSEKEETLTAAQRLFFWAEYKKTIKLD